MRLPPQGTRQALLCTPCSAQKAATCRFGFTESSRYGKGWERNCFLLKVSCRPLTFLSITHTFEHSVKTTPRPAKSHPCLLPDEHQALRGTHLEEWGHSKSRLHGANKAPRPWYLLFLGSLELSYNLQLTWWTLSHLSATLTACSRAQLTDQGFKSWLEST